jgi:hypothetical protein
VTTQENMSETEKKLLRIMENNDGQVVAVGIVEVRAAQRLIWSGKAVAVRESQSSVDQWGAGSMTIQLPPSN